MSVIIPKKGKITCHALQRVLQHSDGDFGEIAPQGLAQFFYIVLSVLERNYY